MQSGTVNIERSGQELPRDKLSDPDRQQFGLNPSETSRFASNESPPISKIFGDNISMQRHTFALAGAVTLIMLPFVAWVRSRLGSSPYHPLTDIVVLISMVGCLPAIFSSFYPKIERFAGHSLTAVLTASFISLIALNGGLSAPILVAAPLLPMTAAYLVGPRAGLTMGFLIVFSITAMIVYSLVSTPVVSSQMTGSQTELAYAFFVAIVSLAAALKGWGLHRRFTQLQAELLYSATHDSLTGAANRKSLETALFREAEKRRTSYSVSLLVLDIDHFKRFNDKHGHQAGDRVLKTVVGIADNIAKRNTDVVARYGGDEFVIVLPDTNHDTALAIAEQLRSSVEKQRLQFGWSDKTQTVSTQNSRTLSSSDKSVITLSVGVATHPAGRYDNPHDFADDLMASADLAMYRSKQAGGNCVTGSGDAVHSANKFAETAQ